MVCCCTSPLILYKEVVIKFWIEVNNFTDMHDATNEELPNRRGSLVGTFNPDSILHYSALSLVDGESKIVYSGSLRGCFDVTWYIGSTMYKGFPPYIGVKFYDIYGLNFNNYLDSENLGGISVLNVSSEKDLLSRANKSFILSLNTFFIAYTFSGECVDIGKIIYRVV